MLSKSNEDDGENVDRRAGRIKFGELFLTVDVLVYNLEDDNSSTNLTKLNPLLSTCSR
jgi:hypothetical protein